MNAGSRRLSTFGGAFRESLKCAGRASTRLAAIFIAPLLMLAVFVGVTSVLPQDFDVAAHPTVERLDLPGPQLAPGEGLIAEGSPFDQRLRAGTAVWLRFTLPAQTLPTPRTLEIRHTRVQEAAFWLEETFGAGAAGAPTMEYRVDSLGLHVDLPASQTATQTVIARIVPASPGRMIVRADPFGSHGTALGRFDKAGGLLAGFFVALALFAALVALINRDLTFWLFAGWLVTTYRIAAINGGWDLDWMGLGLQADDSLTALRTTAALHGLLTAVLYLTLFRHKLPRWLQSAGELVGVSFLLVLAISPIASNTTGQALIRIVGIAGGAMQLVGLFAIFKSSLDRPMKLAAVAWAVNLAGTLMTILYAAGALDQVSRVINAQTAAMVTGFLVAIALADRLRSERLGRLRAQTAAVTALKKFQTTYDSVPAGLFSMQEDGRFVDFNPAFAEMLDSGSPSDKPVDWSSHFPQPELSRLLAEIERTGSADSELRSNDADRWFQVKARRPNALIEGSMTEITQRRLAQDSLRRLADHDPLTDALNRRGFGMALQERMAGWPEGQELFLACVDLDRFKLINDLFGHASGDHVLKEVCRRIVFALPADASFARLGGDEFAILMSAPSLWDAQRVCEGAIEAAFVMPYSIADKSFAVFGSIGLVEMTTTMSDKDALSAADRACAQAKSRGGNQVVVYSQVAPELAAHFEELRMVEKMGARLPTTRMRMVCQPIVSLQAPFANLNYEALLRFIDDDGKLAPPMRLIQAAERHGFMARIDRWVLNTMLAWLDQHPEHRDRLDYCAINLSGASLNDERFLKDVMGMITDHPAAARRICFEVTETVALYDLKNTQRFIDRVRGFGSKVALDDFGAGYTSFKYLKELRVDLIKIDGAYVRSIASDRSNYSITRTIVDLARELGASSVAEWAESAEVVEMLSAMGVDYAQGYALAKPMAVENLLEIRSSGELVTAPDVLATLRNPPQPVFRLRDSSSAPTTAHSGVSATDSIAARARRP